MQNKERFIDLHLHSIYSDGTMTIPEIVACACEKQVAAIALTDHDTIEGTADIARLAQGVGLETVTGVEMSTFFDGSDIHMLGYFMDTQHAELKMRLSEMREIRIARAKKIVERLNAKGVELRFERVLEFSSGHSIGRPHIAAALLAEEHVSSYSRAFDKYLGNHTEFYVPADKMTPADAIALIKKAGGIAVWAHPQLTDRDELLAGMVDAGLDGLEVYCNHQPPKVHEHYRALCKKYGLVETGGSDCHGPRYDGLSLGTLNIPYEVLEKMKARAGRL